ncbi:MAG: MerR family transcriptional regulator, partial [Verrucomicrobiae bacterium]|nr:MerR family transcriptional regulator [Verrucomicrobiae bacterium]
MFGISTVSRLTGISPHTLRIWERRYGVVDPGRTDTKRREYSREDIRRLSLIKTLVDHGHSIRHVAALPIASLESLVQESLPPSGKPVALTRVAFAGSVSREELRSAVDSGPGLKLIGEFDSLDDLAGSLKQGAFDLLIVEIPTLFEEEASQVQQITTDMGARRAVILYRFAKRQVIAPFEQNDCGITAIRAPVSAAELRLALLANSSFATRANLAEKSSAELSVEDFPLSD